MIIGTFIRFFKTYQGINFIPITDNDQFCGLVGENGIGKSSVLEALDTFFNSKSWNFNIAAKRSGLTSSNPYIVPIFLIKRSEFTGDLFDKASMLNDVALSLQESEVNLSHRPHLKSFNSLASRVKENIDLENYFVLPIGNNYNMEINISIFNCEKLVRKVLSQGTGEVASSLTQEELEQFVPLLNHIKKIIDYIYIPREIDPEQFTNLETKEIQILMGETLTQILSQRVPQSQISEINTSLNAFIDTLAEELDIYSYRTPTDRQQNLKKADVYNLIIQAFFNIRKLHKKQGDSWLEINALSSGEKQKAIIDVAHSLLSQHRESGSNLIIAVDEPESSLHMSACFDQFDALYDISRDCMQIIFSSHWYGFLPTIESGSATVISRQDTNHIFDQIDLARYREQIKQMGAESRGKLPYDIRLKSINDFVQSIITSAIGDSPYNWLICEGSSEKIYFSKYYEDLLESKKLRIVPVGGAKEIKRLYKHLSTSYEDFKDEINGKIILISDTDSELVRYEVNNYDNLICKRIVNCSNKATTTLVNIQSNPVSPATEIEHSLNGRLFLTTLRTFQENYPELLSFLDEITEEVTENSTHFSLDLKTSQWTQIEQFFDTDNNKFLFAKKYVENMDDSYAIPAWIQEIRIWIE
ncbi:AAA family ATPase [Sulfurimonas sp. HSL3-7]|uniref:AAA family ATPase n=1 Tax=Sulfonitrofixus jiaomeiensis TaxID=3131938 RepID=UPI0031F7B36E